MSAQPGDHIVLGYGAQPGSAQPGTNVIINYSYVLLLNNTVRANTHMPWVVGSKSRRRTRMPFATTVQLDPFTHAPWATGVPNRRRTRSPWVLSHTADANRRAPWLAFADRNTSELTAPWVMASFADHNAAAPWGKYSGYPAINSRLPWVQPVFADRALDIPWGLYQASRTGMLAIFPRTIVYNPHWQLPWVRYSRPLNPGWGVVTPPNEPPTDEHGTIVVPTLRSYIVVNNVVLQRTSNSLALPALSMQLSIDADSWGWGWSSSLPAKNLPDLEPDDPDTPVELTAQINGVQWQLILEKVSRDRQFGKDRIAISGRGIAATLADPFFPIQTHDNVDDSFSSQQLADLALSFNGVSLGWTLDWQIADWLVPAGAWVHTGTPIEAVARIAEAGGGYVQADAIEKTLHVLPRYPSAPWLWNDLTPDFILPSSATTREATEYISLPDYNVVYVSGGQIGGVLGQVKITGTAGDLAAPMIVDPLVTHVDPARGRGTAVLGYTGKKQILTLETPILESIGLYPVGAMIEWQEGAQTRRGLVRSSNITAELPKVRQVIQVECRG